jgi:putative nucleotidyltransferase with HDIG domain
MHQPCVSAEQACSMLGVKVLKNVVMQVAVIKHYDHLNESGFDMNVLWSHAIKTAQASSFLAQRSRVGLPIGPDDFYTCGLLHDLGQVVLLDGMSESYVRLLMAAAERNLPRHVAETRVLGYNHTELGALIAERWSLPKPVCDAIRGHHGPREAVEGDQVTSLVANANLLVERLDEGKLNAAANVFDSDTTRFLGLNGQDVIDLIEHLSANAAAAVV